MPGQPFEIIIDNNPYATAQVQKTLRAKNAHAIDSAAKTHDPLFRHLKNLKQLDTSQDPDDVPEIFFLLVNFFDQNPEVYQIEGIFHVSCSDQHLYELEVHMSLKNYSVLKQMTDRPQVVANYLKRVLQEMSEPLVPFRHYRDFRDLAAPSSDESNSPHGLSMIEDGSPIDKRQARLSEIHDLVNLLPPINRNTLQYLCKFFRRVS